MERNKILVNACINQIILTPVEHDCKKKEFALTCAPEQQFHLLSGREQHVGTEKRNREML